MRFLVRSFRRCYRNSQPIPKPIVVINGSLGGACRDLPTQTRAILLAATSSSICAAPTQFVRSHAMSRGLLLSPQGRCRRPRRASFPCRARASMAAASGYGASGFTRRNIMTFFSMHIWQTFSGTFLRNFRIMLRSPENMVI